MILIDKPYLSPFLKKTISEHSLPVVKTRHAQQLGLTDENCLIETESVIAQAREAAELLIYTNSENAIGWISEHLAFTGLPEKIDLFKNKLKFRSLLSPLYPDFFFRAVSLSELNSLPIEQLPLPFIIKPSVGFFSMGVHKVSEYGEWPQILEALNTEIRQVKQLYPPEVLNTTEFIIEQYIEGDEYAVDAYFNNQGEPVILNILQHVFSSASDVSDRVYLSSKQIIETHLAQFTAFLEKVGLLAEVKNFPLHVEIRRLADGSLVPIEINPMRFGGWCTTADATFFAYGFNPYLYYFAQQKPNWEQLLRGKAGKLYSIVVLDNSTGFKEEQIADFDYDKLLAGFEKLLELRKIDYREYPVFGFLFTETREDNFSELERILKSDLKEFITLNPSA